MTEYRHDNEVWDGFIVRNQWQNWSKGPSTRVLGLIECGCPNGLAHLDHIEVGSREMTGLQGNERFSFDARVDANERSN